MESEKKEEKIKEETTEAGWCEALRMLCEDYLGVAPILPGDSVIIIRDACVKANLGWNRDNYCPLHLARGFFV